jgi:peptidoglycan/LPS O-acetylase OafA/YrhL
VPNQWWLWLYAANFSELAHVSFEPMFSHFWSLAIEEQFYIVWPLVVLVLPRNSLMVVSAFLAVGSALLRCTLIGGGYLPAELAANLTFSRLDGLAMGALVACLARGNVGLEGFRWAAIYLAALGGSATVLLKIFYGSTAGNIWSLSGAGHYTMCAAVCGILILAASARGFWFTVLSNPALRFFGKYSYGLYVFHYLLQPWIDPSFWFVTSMPVVSLLIHMACATGVSVVVALLSWHLYEKQFLKLKSRFDYAPDRHSAHSAPETAFARNSTT